MYGVVAHVVITKLGISIHGLKEMVKFGLLSLFGLTLWSTQHKPVLR